MKDEVRMTKQIRMTNDERDTPDQEPLPTPVLLHGELNSGSGIVKPQGSMSLKQ